MKGEHMKIKRENGGLIISIFADEYEEMKKASYERCKKNFVEFNDVEFSIYLCEQIEFELVEGLVHRHIEM